MLFTDFPGSKVNNFANNQGTMNIGPNNTSYQARDHMVVNNAPNNRKLHVNRF